MVLRPQRDGVRRTCLDCGETWTLDAGLARLRAGRPRGFSAGLRGGRIGLVAHMLQIWSMNGEPYVEVARVTNLWRDRARTYRIFIDGTEVGMVSRGSTWKLAIPPGPHRMRLKIDWCRSREVSFYAQPGEITTFRCGPNAASWRILYDATIGWNRYISLALR